MSHEVIDKLKEIENLLLSGIVEIRKRNEYYVNNDSMEIFVDRDTFVYMKLYGSINVMMDLSHDEMRYNGIRLYVIDSRISLTEKPFVRVYHKEK